VVWGRP